MIEQQQTPDQLNNIITPNQLWESFNKVQKGTREGYGSALSRLTTYRDYIANVNRYFSQSELKKNKNQDAERLISEMFRQNKTAETPLEFCQQTGSRLEQDINPRERHAWEDSITLIKDLSKQELLAMNQSVMWEQHEQEKLLRTATQLSTLPEQRKKEEQSINQILAGISREAEIARGEPLERGHIPHQEWERTDTERAEVSQEKLAADAITIELQSKKERRLQIRERAIQSVPELRSKASKIDSATRILDQVLDGRISYQELETDYHSVTEYIRLPDGDPNWDEVKIKLEQGTPRKADAIIQRTVKKMKEPEYIWKELTKAGDIPPELTQSFDEIMLFVELQETAEAISGLPQKIKAEYLRNFLDKGISAGLLVEIMESKYEFPDNFIEQQIDAFIHFNDTYEKGKKKKGSNRKVVLALLAIMGTTMLLSSDTYQAELSKPKTNKQIEQVIQKPPQKIPDSHENKPDRKGIKIHFGKGEGKGEGNNGSGSGAGKNSSSDITQELTVKNDSVESFNEALKQIVWKLEGSDINGYYTKIR